MASIIRTDALQNLNTSNIISQTNATTLTLGYSGQTIAVASGATLLGGGITWTSTVVTSAMTVAVNTGYFVNTSSNAITVTLPASASVGNTIILSDFNRTWATNNLTLNQNSLNFQGYTSPNPVYNTAGQTVQLVYSGATQGWIPTSDDNVTNETPQAYSIDFLVIAGGGAAGGYLSGGGAGGYRTSTQTVNGGTTITVTVGDGGAGGTTPTAQGASGSNSSISGTGLTTITSAGGGGGGSGGQPNTDPRNGVNGGSGGGGGGTKPAGTPAPGGSGNTPSTSPSQGSNGGTGGSDDASWTSGGGGGGAGGVGTGGTQPAGGNGGNGTASSITGSSVTRAGGGGAGADYTGATQGTGGTGGGGNGNYTSAPGGNGTANTGGGGGGASGYVVTVGSGGKGVVILSMATANYTGTTTGSPTVTTKNAGADTVLQFNGSGSYTT
jgi:hypothetical protein